MQSLFKTLFIGTLLIVGTAATAFAADPAIGTWELNLAKSTFTAGHAPRSQTRTYAESAQGVVLTVKTVAANGKESTTTLTFKTDGKPYPVSGNPDFDSVSVKRVNARTVHSVQMKGSTTVGTAVRTVSKDGKTLTFVQKSMDAGSATKYDDKVVYDRQ